MYYMYRYEASKCRCMGVVTDGEIEINTELLHTTVILKFSIPSGGAKKLQTIVS